MEANQSRFEPGYYRSPGDFLKQLLDASEITKADLARRCDRPLKIVSQILAGDLSMTPGTALQFERVLGVPANRWLQLEAAYQLSKTTLKEVRNLGAEIEWAKSFPLRDLRKRGYIAESRKHDDIVKSLLKFLGTASPDAWRKYSKEFYFPALFRRSTAFESNQESILAWLRIGEIKAKEIRCKPYDSGKFRDVLKDARKFMGQSRNSFENPLRENCAHSGVAFVIVSDVSRGHLSGAARWVSKDKAVLQLSNRGNRDDLFWFSFYHEAAHILLHAKKEVFVDERSYGPSQEEQEANAFAATALLPKRFWADYFQSQLKPGEKRFSHDRIRRFAKIYGVTPGIIVGQLIYKNHLKHGRNFEKLFSKVDSKSAA